ncbi:MAG: lytic murein transglycosylase [Verrucomicrobiaceae bacterium]|nr:lytic murein transglycosylase [Verrucomicrobiaceae bacterium]
MGKSFVHSFTRSARWIVAGWLGLSVCASADYSQHPQANAFVDEMVKQHGFKREEMVQWLSRAERQQSVLDAIARPAEKAKPWKDYRKLFVTTDRIQQGVAFWRDHAASLTRAERVSGVPAGIIVAILGVETRYGRNTGNYRVLDSLTTLSFDYPPRADFFRSQLVEFFLMTREQKLAPDRVLGSYAGAMGFGQFMPSSYRKFAVDFDGDGEIDIVNDIDDAIGSVANYLKEYGWQRGGLIVTKAQVKEPLPDGLLREVLEPVTTLADYKRKSIASVAVLPDSTLAALFLLDGDNGNEYWLALNNFYVITRYNRSQMYALAVVQLSEEITAQWSR